MATLRMTDDPVDMSGYAKATRRTYAGELLIADNRGVPTLLAYLDASPRSVEQLAVEWGRLAYALPVRDRALPAALRSLLGREPLPDVEGWPGMVAYELARFPTIQSRVGVDATHLAEVLAKQRELSVIHNFSGRAKDGALDLRITVGAWGWYQVTEMLIWLRDKVAAATPAQRSQLMADWAPVLVLMTEEQTEVAERRADLAAARAEADSAAEVAETNARLAEALLAYRRGEELTPDQLLELALHNAQRLAQATGSSEKGRAETEPKRKTPRGGKTPSLH